MKPFIWEPEHVYHGNEQYVGSTKLKNYASRPTKWFAKNDINPAAALNGRVVHCMVLEPNEFDSKFAWVGEIDGRTKEGKTALAAIRASGKEPIKPSKTILGKDEVEALAASVRGHPVAGPILQFGRGEGVARRIHTSPSGNQVGLQARMDWVTDDMRTVADLKTCQDLDRIHYSVRDYGYLTQVGHYVYTAEEYLPEIPNWFFIFVEKSAPYDVAVLEIPKAVIMEQIKRVKAIADRLADSIANDNWENGYEHALVWDMAKERPIKRSK